MAWTDMWRAEEPMRKGASDGWPGSGGMSAPAPSIDCDDRPTLLLAAPMGRAATMAEWANRAGLRCIGSTEPQALAQRLRATVAIDLILLDLRGAPPETLDARTLCVRHELGSTRLVILTDLDGLDLVMAQLDGPDVDILCEPSASDIVSLLVTSALSLGRRDLHLHDTTRDAEAGRIEQLSEEVRRLAMTIERLTHNHDERPRRESLLEPVSTYRAMTPERPAMADGPHGRSGSAGAEPLHPGEIRALLRARRLREQFLPADLFADPAWDMILDLMAARLAGQRVSVSSLCIAAAVPPTTALRWIRQLTERGVFSRIDDPADGRRVFIELTDEAATAFAAWVQSVRRNGGLLSPHSA